MQDRIGRLFKNRGGAVIAGAVAAVLAVILLVVYLQSYRSSIDSGKRPADVLIATKLIPRGMSGSLIAKEGLYKLTSVEQDQLKPLAIDDPSVIAGRLAAGDIYPGQQLTQDDFTTETSTSIPYEITGKQRAIAIPVDSSHGLVGQVTAGDFVDVYVGVSAGATGNLVTLLEPDVLVLVAPGTGSSDAILRITTDNAPKFAFAADNARIWLILRPQIRASVTPPKTATLASLLAEEKANG